ncbi:ribonuclease H-like domain-containing protein [Tanacetum coccineum]
MEAYFQKVESLMTILSSLDSPVSEDDVVQSVLMSSLKYNQGAVQALPKLSAYKTILSLLHTEEMRLKTFLETRRPPSPYGAFGLNQPAHGSSATPGLMDNTSQATLLPQAFTTGTLHDPPTGNMEHDNRDFLTRRVLLRCDSTGDLYPVTSPSPIPHAFLVSQHTWHQRLGHPGSEVLRRLISSKFISCNKEKPPVLCHACPQLGKHCGSYLLVQYSSSFLFWTLYTPDVRDFVTYFELPFRF